jgi:hypothetical protein
VLRRAGVVTSSAIILALMLTMLSLVPLQESKNLSASWYTIVYYVLIAVTAAVTGLLVAIVLMLYNALQSLIAVLRPGIEANPGSSSQDSGA